MYNKAPLLLLFFYFLSCKTLSSIHSFDVFIGRLLLPNHCSSLRTQGRPPWATEQVFNGVWTNRLRPLDPHLSIILMDTHIYTLTHMQAVNRVGEWDGDLPLTSIHHFSPIHTTAKCLNTHTHTCIDHHTHLLASGHVCVCVCLADGGSVMNNNMVRHKWSLPVHSIKMPEVWMLISPCCGLAKWHFTTAHMQSYFLIPFPEPMLFMLQEKHSCISNKHPYVYISFSRSCDILMRLDGFYNKKADCVWW